MATQATVTNSNGRQLAPTYEQLKAQLAELQAKLATKSTRAITPKVSQKGAVSVYGLSQRYPVTLYASQWERMAVSILGFASIEEFYAKSELGKFIKDNSATISRKEE